MTTIAAEEFETPGVPLTDLISVGRRFLRSVNLEQDFYTSAPLDGYILTTSGLSALERIVEGIHHPHARAFSITGSYGSGKSAFALFASKVLAPHISNDFPDSPRLRVVAQHPALRERLLSEHSAGYLPVLVTGRRAPIAKALLNALLIALEKSSFPNANALVARLKKDYKAILSSPLPTSTEVTRVFSETSKNLIKSVSGCSGILVVIDEMGKFLEYAALYPEQGDMYVFQELAEYAARSEAAPLMLVTILHQAFEEYAHKLSATQRREWQKVQGRFIDIPFGDRTDETIHLIGQAIQQSDTMQQSHLLDNLITSHLEECRRLQLPMPNLSGGEYRELLRKTSPLHPITLCLLPTAFRRFGQSERSLFSFLSSDEPFSFQSFLSATQMTDSDLPLFRPDALYDYIVTNLGSGLYTHATARLWSEAEEALYRLRDRDPLQVRLLKTIALLQILGEQTEILPSKETLVFALADNTTPCEKIEAALDALKAATFIVYRRFRRAYRLYEGSDVDIEARLRDAHAHFALGTDTVAVAKELEVSPPFVARQHSFRTGTLRIFEVRHCRPDTLEAEIRRGRGQADGAMILCLASDMEGMERAERIATELLPDMPEIVLGISQETEALSEAAVAVECLRWVEDKTDELRHDRAASREVRERLNEAINAFRQEWDRLLRPQGIVGAGGIWFHRCGRVAISSQRQLQELVSQACDAAYPATPILQNEIVNRRQLSSTAAAARRNLIEAMIRHRSTPRLGIEGFPPEISMYISVLENKGIHRQDVDGVWKILPPPLERDKGLTEAWQEIERFFFQNDLRAQPLSNLNQILRAKPYGITEGIIPILVCAALLYHENEVALYEDGRFVTELDSATFERMIKRPADFKLRGCQIIGERKAVLDRFARNLLQGETEPKLVDVVRRIYREFNKLPEYTTKTRNLGDKALALRDLFKESREPETLLFMDAPRVLEVQPFGDQEADPEAINEFFSEWNAAMSEILGVYSKLLGTIETQICSTFEVYSWDELRDRAKAIRDNIAEPILTGFVNRASDSSLSRVKWLESVSAGVVGRPPDTWNDKDIERFSNQLPKLVRAFQHSELLHFEKNSSDSSTEQSRVLLAVTQETGKETARIIHTSKSQSELIAEVKTRILTAITPSKNNISQEIILAAIAEVMQEMLEGKENV